MAPILILDPGHGGIDPGGGSNQQFTEKDMTLQISRYQERRFRELNVSVAMTRTGDITVDSEARATMVRNSGARYCISNHINVGGGRGAEIIYSIHASPAFPKSLKDDLEAAGMPVRRVFTRTYPGDPNKDYYFMNRETGSVETIILEYGFADNPLDTQKLVTDWQELAEAVVRGFCEFAKLPYQPPKVAPPVSPKPEQPGHPQPQPPANPNPQQPAVPEWKREGIAWLYEQGLLTDATWRHRIDEPLPLWAEALVLKRLYEKLQS